MRLLDICPLDVRLLAICLTGMVPLAPMSAVAQAPFSISSAAFGDGGKLPMEQVAARARCGNHGGDLSPALDWTSPPPGTKSLAVTLFDPDARGGTGWWHWALFDLPPDQRSLPENAGRADAPPRGGVEARNSFGDIGYGGACPPPGDAPHHYQFTVWALDEAKLPFEKGAPAEAVQSWLQKHATTKATTTARYGR